jgi:Flp pilus assembly protein TadG
VNRPRSLCRAERRDRERGSITAVVVVFAACFLVLGGLVYDAGRAMAAKTSAIDTAQQAARTAAQALNAGELRNNVLATTPGQAIADAEAYIAASGDTGTVTITGNQITVSVVRRQSTSLLALVGVGEITVEGTASTEIEQGVTTVQGR